MPFEKGHKLSTRDQIAIWGRPGAFMRPPAGLRSSPVGFFVPAGGLLP
jgi:hypothetical protein